MDLTISIVSHNNRELLKQCLDSICNRGGAAGLDYETVVVVNAPGDGSADMLRAEFPAVHIIENASPRGYGANHNAALHGAAGRFVAALNDDVFLEPGCLAALVKFLEAHPDAGAAGPRTLNPDGSVQESCFRLPTLAVLFYDAVFLSSIFPRSEVTGGFKRWAHDTTRAVPHILGACMVMPRAAFEAADGFDEGFFLYYEEADLCKRLHDAGLKTYFVANAVLTHHAGASISGMGGEQTALFHSSLIRYYEKHFGRAALAGVFAFNVIGAASRLCIYAVAGMLFKNSGERKKTYSRILKWYPNTLFKGREKSGKK